LKIFDATFGFGGAIAPIAPNLATRLDPILTKNFRNCAEA